MSDSALRTSECQLQNTLVDACLIEETLIDKKQENYQMIDSLSIWLSSGGTDILGTAHEFQGVEVDFGCTFAHIFRRTPTGWRTRLTYGFLAYGSKMKIPMDKKYQCPK